MLYWYISAIVAFYLIFPLYIRYYTRYGEKILMIPVLTGVLLMTIYTLLINPETCQNEIRFFLSRIPIFFIGVSIGRFSFVHKSISKKQICLLVAFSVISILTLKCTQKLFTYTFLQNTGLNNYPFIF